MSYFADLSQFLSIPLQRKTNNEHFSWQKAYWKAALD